MSACITMSLSRSVSMPNRKPVEWGSPAKPNGGTSTKPKPNDGPSNKGPEGSGFGWKKAAGATGLAGILAAVVGIGLFPDAAFNNPVCDALFPSIPPENRMCLCCTCSIICSLCCSCIVLIAYIQFSGGGNN